MSMKDLIWTGEVRRMLYSRLVTLFGPHFDWPSKGGNGSQPSSDEAIRIQFREFLAAFALVIGAKSDEAVRQQINWAIQNPEETNGGTRICWTNKVMAYECGFINTSYFPMEAVNEYKK